MQIPNYGYTYYHRVMINRDNPDSSTHHPYVNKLSGGE